MRNTLFNPILSFSQETKSLEDLIRVVDGEKYNCHASSILDTEEVTDQMASVSLKPNKRYTHIYQLARDAELVDIVSQHVSSY